MFQYLLKIQYFPLELTRTVVRVITTILNKLTLIEASGAVLGAAATTMHKIEPNFINNYNHENR